MLPAILVKDKIVTGTHHGDAFSKLTEEEKKEQVLSGFLDNNKFITDEETIYLKDIILLRHAQSNEAGCITPEGCNQAVKTAEFLKTVCIGYYGFCSPYLRCKQTSEIIKNTCSVSFQIDPHLEKQTNCENSKDFSSRIIEMLDILPKKSILITHTDFIQNTIVYLVKHNLKSIANCSITYISQNKLIWLTKVVNA